jgi:hypothetical protein
MAIRLNGGGYSYRHICRSALGVVLRQRISIFSRQCSVQSGMRSDEPGRAVLIHPEEPLHT